MIPQGINLSGKQGAGHQVRGESALGSSYPGVRESFHKGPAGNSRSSVATTQGCHFYSPKAAADFVLGMGVGAFQ